MYCVGLFGPAFSATIPKHPFPTSKSRDLNARNRNLALSYAKEIPPRVAPKASHFDLVPPPIDHDLLETMTIAGAQALEDGTVETFGNDDLALNAASDADGVVVVDLSHFGRIRVTGEDRIQFLHNQSTANFESLHEGQGCDTVFVTPTARTIDIAHAWVMRNAVTLLVSPTTCKSIIEMLNKYIFVADKVEIHDITKETCFFILVGPKSTQVMENLNLGDLVGQPYGTHQHYSVDGMPVTVGVGSLLSEEGFSLLLSPAAAGSVWKTLLSLGAIPMGTDAWERLRVLQGRPAPGKELTNEFNVLEAGLWRAISQNKGCYKGQETISRLITYDGIKQNLWGIHLSAPAEPGSPITVNEKKVPISPSISVSRFCSSESGTLIGISKQVGKLTSYVIGRGENEHIGLGYIKRKTCSVGDVVNIGDVVGKVVNVPFLSDKGPESLGANR